MSSLDQSQHSVDPLIAEKPVSRVQRFTVWFDAHREPIAIVLMVLLQCIWTTMQLTMKALKSKIGGPTQSAIRVWLAIVFLGGFWLVFEYKKTTVRPWHVFYHWKTALLAVYCSLAGCVAYMTLMAWAYEFPCTTAASVGTLFTFTSVFTPLIGALPFFKEEKLNAFKVCGALLGIVGVIITMNPTVLWNDLVSGSSPKDFIGRGIILINALQFSLFVIVNRIFMRMTQLPLFCSQFLIHVISGIFFAVVLGPTVIFEDLREHAHLLTGFDWSLLVYSGLFGSCLGYAINTFGMVNIRSPGVFAAFQLVLPLTNIVGGYLAFNEVPDWWVAGGVVVIGSSLGLVLYGRKIENAALAMEADNQVDRGEDTLTDPDFHVTELSPYCTEMESEQELEQKQEQRSAEGLAAAGEISDSSESSVVASE